MWRVLFAATEWKGPTAGLKPGSPQNLIPSHLALNAGCIRIIRHLFVCQRNLMQLHGFGSLLKNLSKSWLSIWCERMQLRGVVENVVYQRWIVMCHVCSVTETDHSVIATTGSGGRKVWSEKLHLEDRVTWKKTQPGNTCIQDIHQSLSSFSAELD